MSKLLYDDKLPIEKTFSELSEESRELLKEVDISIADKNFIQKIEEAEKLSREKGNRAVSYRLQRVKKYYKKLIDEFGGSGSLTLLEDELARRAAFLSLIAAEEEERAIANGEVVGFDSIDLKPYLDIIKTQVQIYRLLVIERQKILTNQKNEATDLRAYLISKKSYERSKK